VGEFTGHHQHIQSQRWLLRLGRESHALFGKLVLPAGSRPCCYDVGLPSLRHTEAVIIECDADHRQFCQNLELKDIQLILRS